MKKMISKRTMFSSAKPGFICIGPQRTGTTWLYKVLGEHPSVWLPQVKELTVLAEGNNYDVPPYSRWNFFFSKNWHYHNMRRHLLRASVKMLLGRAGFEELGWAWHYSVRPGARRFSLAWYSSLFENQADQLAGDISPAYYFLPEYRVKELSLHCHSLKVILFLRNPIDRIWSATRFFLEKEKGYSGTTPNDVLLRYFAYFQQTWLPYDQVIALWKKYFPEVFVGNFSDLQEQPQAYFREICNFLGIPDNIQIGLLDQKVNKSPDGKIPPDLAIHLIKQHADEIHRLAELGYCRDPQAWLNYGQE